MTTSHHVARALLAGVACLTLVATACAIPVQAATVQTSPAQTSPAPAAIFTLEQAISIALEKSPVIGASLARDAASIAARKQAGAFANPDIFAEAENAYGDYDGLDEAEITYGVSQLVELPGKRGNRIRQAKAERARAHLGLDATRLDLIRDVTIAYAELAAAQQGIKILTEEFSLANAVRDSVAARVKAGKEPLVQQNKAEIARTASQIALTAATRNVGVKQQALAALLGDAKGNYVTALTSLPAIAPAQPLDSYMSRLANTPETRALETDVNKAQADLSLEKANAVPDPTITFGVKDLRGDDAKAFMAGVSVPFPVFNINRAGVNRAAHSLNASKYDQQSAHFAQGAALTTTHSDLANAYSMARALEQDVLPGAEQAFSFARQGYEAGKFSYFEVLDAQRTLFDARKQFNAAILDYHRQRAIIERLTAQHDTHMKDTH